MAAPKFNTTATRRSNSSGSCQVSIWVLILTSLLVFRLTYTYSSQGLDLLSDAGTTADESLFSLLSPGSQTTYALAPKTGKAVALPSIRIEKEENGAKTDQSRSEHGVLYGGKGDKVHLGGFTDIDLHGISPAAWKYMISFFGIKSLMDVGCGRGISTAWFYLHGVDALCLEGSHDGVLQTILPHPETQIIEHDFSRGPWWPEKTYDAVWCVEFLEHVGRNYHKNYFPAFRKSALIFATHSRWGGWHHVEVHDDKWYVDCQCHTCIFFICE
jgi:Methyltransferase domain